MSSLGTHRSDFGHKVHRIVSQLFRAQLSSATFCMYGTLGWESSGVEGFAGPQLTPGRLSESVPLGVEGLAGPQSTCARACKPALPAPGRSRVLSVLGTFGLAGPQLTPCLLSASVPLGVEGLAGPQSTSTTGSRAACALPVSFSALGVDHSAPKPDVDDGSDGGAGGSGLAGPQSTWARVVFLALLPPDPSSGSGEPPPGPGQSTCARFTLAAS